MAQKKPFIIILDTVELTLQQVKRDLASAAFLLNGEVASFALQPAKAMTTRIYVHSVSEGRRQQKFKRAQVWPCLVAEFTVGERACCTFEIALLFTSSMTL